jgi:hypothetical protein
MLCCCWHGRLLHGHLNGNTLPGTGAQHPNILLQAVNKTQHLHSAQFLLWAKIAADTALHYFDQGSCCLPTGHSAAIHFVPALTEEDVWHWDHDIHQAGQHRPPIME